MEIGWFRRNWLVPVLEVGDLKSFNVWLFKRCGESQQQWPDDLPRCCDAAGTTALTALGNGSAEIIYPIVSPSSRKVR
jgi:hypothetical protein